MKKWMRAILIVAGVHGFAVSAQVRPPNASGIAAAHEHLIVSDMAANTAFWTALGAAPVQIGTMNGTHLPSIYVLFQQNRGRGQAAAGAAPPPPPESTVGSVVEAIGLKVKNLKDTLAKLDAA